MRTLFKQNGIPVFGSLTKTNAANVNLTLQCLSYLFNEIQSQKEQLSKREDVYQRIQNDNHTLQLKNDEMQSAIKEMRERVKASNLNVQTAMEKHHSEKDQIKHQSKAKMEELL